MTEFEAQTKVLETIVRDWRENSTPCPYDYEVSFIDMEPARQKATNPYPYMVALGWKLPVIRFFTNEQDPTRGPICYMLKPVDGKLCCVVQHTSSTGHGHFLKEWHNANDHNIDTIGYPV